MVSRHPVPSVVGFAPRQFEHLSTGFARPLVLGTHGATAREQFPFPFVVAVLAVGLVTLRL